MQEYSEILRKKLAEHVGETTTVPKELVDLLDLSKDSVYRRLRGEVPFTLDEAVLISKKYQLSLDLLVSSENNAFGTYRFRPLYGNEPQFSENVRALAKLFRFFKEEKGQLTYVAEAFPIFRLLDSSRLRAFVVYYWKKVVLTYPSHQFAAFDDDYFIPKEYQGIVDELVSDYMSLDLTEIWTMDTIQKLLFQIEYSVEAGFITSIDVLKGIYSEILELLEKTAHAAQSGKNGESNSFQLYDCEIQLENNCVLAESENVSNCFLNFNNFNNLSTSDPLFTKEVQVWIKNLEAKSVQISGQAEKRRNQFFNRQRSLTQSSKERCLAYLNEV